MEREQLILFLNRLLANFFVVYVKCHRYKWFMKGEHIFQLQSVYEQLADDIKSEIDKLAEHILSMDGKPFATMVKFVKEASLEEATADDEEEEMISQLAHDFVQIVEEIDDIGIEQAKKINDHLTMNMLYTIQHTLHQYIWRFKNYDK